MHESPRSNPFVVPTPPAWPPVWISHLTITVLYWHRASFVLLFSAFQKASVHVIDVVDSVLHGHQVVFSLGHLSCAVLPSYLRFGSCVFGTLRRFPIDLRNQRCCLAIGSRDSFPCGSSEMVAHFFCGVTTRNQEFSWATTCDDKGRVSEKKVTRQIYSVFL